MPRNVCTVCTHAERAQIESDRRGGVAYKRLSERYGPAPATLHNHFTRHVAEAMAKAAETREVEHGSAWWTELEDLVPRTKAVLARAEKAGDDRLVLASIRELRSNVELIAKVLGEVRGDGGGTTVVIDARQWNVALEALDAHPEAKAKIIEALGGEP